MEQATKMDRTQAAQPTSRPGTTNGIAIGATAALRVGRAVEGGTHPS